MSKNPRTTAKSLVNDLAKSGFEVSEKTIIRALHRNGLRGYRPRRTPLLQKRHLKARLKFAKDNLQKPEGYWKRVMWSDETLGSPILMDETNLELFGHRDVAYVWRKQGEAYHPKKTVATMKHGGGSIMLWGCFSAAGTGNLVRVEKVMKKEQYEKILKGNLKQSAVKVGLGRRFVFQHDNDPKHTSYLLKAKITTPAQSPDQNPIEHLWGELKSRVHARKPSHLQQLEQFAKEEWANIPQDRCLQLVAKVSEKTTGYYSTKRTYN